MSYREALAESAIAISVSESADLASLGLSEGHLRDAMAEISRHLLALGARLAYGGDLRQHGFSELLFELVARHRRDADEHDDRSGVTNFLAWPVHIAKPASEIEAQAEEIAGTAELVCLALDGARLTLTQRKQMASQQPSASEWSDGLTAMRKVMLKETNARVILGGRTDKFLGAMPGIAEEALLSLQHRQPIFVAGGFGGCARDIAGAIGLPTTNPGSSPNWPGVSAFAAFGPSSLNNGLDATENEVLAKTAHIDQAITLILKGLVQTRSP